MQFPRKLGFKKLSSNTTICIFQFHQKPFLLVSPLNIAGLELTVGSKIDAHVRVDAPDFLERLHTNWFHLKISVLLRNVGNILNRIFNVLVLLHWFCFLIKNQSNVETCLDITPQVSLRITVSARFGKSSSSWEKIGEYLLQKTALRNLPSILCFNFLLMKFQK